MKSAVSVAVLIVEDEKLYRLDLRRLVEKLPGCGVITEASSVADAAQRWESADVVFLDINLAGNTGFELTGNRRRDTGPVVIFTTASGEHAVRAFDVGAADYLLKPVEESRLREAWAQALTRLETRRIKGDTRFPMPTATGVEMVRAADLLTVSAEGNYVKLRLLNRTDALVRRTFKEWIESFPPGRLIEISRGLAVNRGHILGMDGSKDPKNLVMRDGARLPVSRRRADEVEAALRDAP